MRPIYSAISKCSLSLIIPSCLNQLSHTSPPRPTYRATMWSSNFLGLWGPMGVLISFTLTSSPTLDSRQYGQVTLGFPGTYSIITLLLHYPSPKLDSHFITNSNDPNTEAVQYALPAHHSGSLTGLRQPGTTGGGSMLHSDRLFLLGANHLILVTSESNPTS